MYIGCVQTCSRFVKNINSLSCRAARKLGRKLDALRLAAGKRRCRLTDFDIAETDIVEGLQFALYLRYAREELKPLFNGHFEHIIDIFALVFDFECFAVVSCALADVAGHIDIGEEVHLYLHYSVALARLAASAFDIERESVCFVSPRFCLGS